jgi:Protein of unknown function (DUF3349)
LEVSALAKLTGFLRAGYPDAAPRTGYVPALALLRRRLTEDEVCAVSAELAAWGDALIDDIQIGATIIRITHDLPAVEDIDRVRHRLEELG